MKRNGIRILLALLLITVLMAVSITPAAAGKPVKGWVDITSCVAGNITFDYGWNKVSVHSYQILIAKYNWPGPSAGGPGTIYNSGIISLGERTPSGGEEDVSITSAQTTSPIEAPGYVYYVILWLYGKNSNHGPIKSVRPYDIYGTGPA